MTVLRDKNSLTGQYLSGGEAVVVSGNGRRDANRKPLVGNWRRGTAS